YPYYKDTMYPVMQVDEDKLVLRPMSCPHHFMLYSARPRSYRELPMKIAEVAKLYRYEKSGELSGLTRVRSFCLADAHIITKKSDAEAEIKKVIELIDYTVGVLGLKKGEHYTYRLSLGDPKNKKKYHDDPKGWREGETALRNVLKEMRAPFYEAEDEAAFYGPKIDIQMKNVLGKEDTAFTVQYDFCLPSRFKLRYISDKGKEEQPIVIHRSSIGALERTIAFLIEHHAGALPLWLSPVQAAILPVSEKFEAYAKKLLEAMREQSVRVELSDPNETLGKRIREAEMRKIPYILVVGEKEQNNSTANVRHYRRGQEGEILFEKLTEKIKKEIGEKAI
ncbi:MAG: threonine--tRNA ligase, partial [Patescibacteria group bacterium]